MMTTIRGFWRNFIGQRAAEVTETAATTKASADVSATQINSLDLDIAPNDPLLAYVQQNPGVVDVSQLKLGSAAVTAMREAGIRLIVPLVSQGELIGLINLGSRLSEQEYDEHQQQHSTGVLPRSTCSVRANSAMLLTAWASTACTPSHSRRR